MYTVSDLHLHDAEVVAKYWDYTKVKLAVNVPYSKVMISHV